MAIFSSSRSLMVSVAAPILFLQLACGSAAPASAMCVARGTELVWSYPADGARDVPIDATLWVWSRELNVRLATLNGKRVDHRPVGFGGVRVEPGPLEPNTAYALALKGSRDQGKVVISFRTGVETSPVLSKRETVIRMRGYSTSREFPSDPRCVAVLEAQDCFDTGQDTLLTLRATSDDAIAWVLSQKFLDPGTTIVWPAECGDPSVYLHGTSLPEICYQLEALYPGGQSGDPVSKCGFGQQTSIRPCPDSPPETGNFTPPALASVIEPVFSHIAWVSRQSGTVLIRAVVGESGQVEATEILEPATMGLGQVTAEQMQAWRFEPATRDGVPVRSTICLETEFPKPPLQRRRQTQH